MIHCVRLWTRVHQQSIHINRCHPLSRFRLKLHYFPTRRWGGPQSRSTMATSSATTSTGGIPLMTWEEISEDHGNCYRDGRHIGPVQTWKLNYQAMISIRDRSPSRGLGDVYKRQVYYRGPRLLQRILSITTVSYTHLTLPTKRIV